LAQQQSKCAYCGLTFTGQSLIEIDHRVPTSQGGSNLLSNKQALHRHCHDQKHSDRPSLWGIGANDHMPEEPDEVNVSRPVCAVRRVVISPVQLGVT
jgi:RNA-directed DNA polymerase